MVAPASPDQPTAVALAPAEPEVLLDPRRERFACLVADGFSQSDAYRQVSNVGPDTKPSTVWVHASMLAAEEKVARRIDALRRGASRELAQSYSVTRARVLAEMHRIATVDPRRLIGEDGRPLPLDQLPDDVAAAVEQVDVATAPDGTPIGYRYRLARKGPLLDQLARVLGMYEADNRQRAGSLAEALAAVAGQPGAPSPRIAPQDAG